MTATSVDSVLKCSNPACREPFEPEHGSFFRLRRSTELGPAVERYWLCPRCSASYTIGYAHAAIHVIPRASLNPFIPSVQAVAELGSALSANSQTSVRDRMDRFPPRAHQAQ